MERFFDRLGRRFDEMSREFEDAVEESPLPTSPSEAAELPSAPTPPVLSGSAAARVDVADEGDAYVVAVDLPGYESEEIDLQLRDGRLRLEATRESTAEESDATYVRRERTRQSVSRTIPLPGPVVEDEVSAAYRNGVLSVTLPKVDEEGGGRRIDVE